jgi:hypothetical protein
LIWLFRLLPYSRSTAVLKTGKELMKFTLLNRGWADRLVARYSDR